MGKIKLKTANPKAARRDEFVRNQHRNSLGLNPDPSKGFSARPQGTSTTHPAIRLATPPTTTQESRGQSIQAPRKVVKIIGSR